MSILVSKNIENFLQKKLLHNTNLSQSLLFWGPSNLGKMTTAIHFSRSILCVNQKWGGCNSCQNCKYFNDSWHPDLMVISNKDNIISKNEIVEAESFLMLKPLFSHKKILIINKAEKLNYEAQSALLKSLEEPKSQFLIILVSSMPQRFLKTIKSRLLPIRFIKPKTDVLIDFLVKNYSTTKEQAAEAALLSLNQTGHAIKLITQKDFLIQTKENQKYFLKIHQRNFSKQVAVLDELIKKIESSPEKNEKTKTKKINQTQLKTVINDWLALVEKNLAETILNENQASNLSLKQQKTLLKNTLKLLYYLDNYNLNQKLLLDNFCLKTF